MTIAQEVNMVRGASIHAVDYALRRPRGQAEEFPSEIFLRDCSNNLEMPPRRLSCAAQEAPLEPDDYTASLPLHYRHITGPKTLRSCNPSAIARQLPSGKFSWLLKPMRMLIVEDDFKIRSFLVKGFQENGFVVDQAETGEDGLTLASATTYDVAIVDLMLPGLDGLSLIERLRADKVPLPILVLSAKRALEDRVSCLQRGADDYVGKPFAFSEVLARTQAIIRRSHGTIEPSRLAVADIVLDRLSREVTRDGKKIDLQIREFALLEHLMRNCGKALSKAFLLERLWDYSFDPQTNVVDVLVCRLRNKIDKDFPTKLIHTLRGVGYVLRAG